MGDEKPFEKVSKTRPGHEVLRKRREPKRRLRIAPNVPRVHSQIGMVYGRLGRFDEAEAHLRIAVRHFPELGAIHRGLAAIEVNRKNWEAALRHAEAAAALDSVDPADYPLLQAVRAQVEAARAAGGRSAPDG